MSSQLSKTEQEKRPLEDWRTSYAQRLRGEIAADWCVKNVGDICSIRTGKIDVNQADEDGAYPFFTCADKVYRINTPAFDTEAVLLAGNGDFNVKYYKGKFNAYQRTYVLSDLQVEGKYLYYYISYRLRDLTGDSRGSTIKYIRLGDVRDYPVPVAPLDQQKRIVAEIEKQLSRLDEAVANLKRVKVNLKRYKTAVLRAAVEGRLVETEAELARREGRSYETGAQLLQRILETRRSKWKGKGKYKEPTAPDTTDLPELPEGWVWATLDQAGQEGRPIIYGIIKPGPHDPHGVPYVRVTEMKDGFIDLARLKKAAPARAAKFARATLAAGDILISKDGTIGRVAVVPAQLAGGNITQHVMRAPIHELMCRDYIVWSIRSDHCQRWLTGETKGVALRGVNVEDFRRLPVPVPSLSEQQRIAYEIDRRLSLVREVEAQVDANLKRAERLRQSVLYSAFSNNQSI
jgi:type I restriction enzyme S subunit